MYYNVSIRSVIAMDVICLHNVTLSIVKLNNLVFNATSCQSYSIFEPTLSLSVPPRKENTCTVNVVLYSCMGLMW